MSALFALLLTGWLQAADYTADLNHSTLEFSVGSALFDAHGTFQTWSVTATLPDGADLSGLRGAVTVDVASVDTRVRKRDDHLRSGDFFDVAVHPKATFVIAGVTADGETLTATGALSLKGVEKELSIPLKVLYKDADRLRLTGEYVLKRRDFGIIFDSSVNPIGEEVTVRFDLNLMRDGAAPLPDPSAGG